MSWAEVDGAANKSEADSFVKRLAWYARVRLTVSPAGTLQKASEAFGRTTFRRMITDNEFGADGRPLGPQKLVHMLDLPRFFGDDPDIVFLALRKASGPGAAWSLIYHADHDEAHSSLECLTRQLLLEPAPRPRLAVVGP